MIIVHAIAFSLGLATAIFTVLTVREVRRDPVEWSIWSASLFASVYMAAMASFSIQRILGIMSFVLAVLIVPSIATAQNAGGPLEGMQRHLEKKYEERLIWSGAANNGITIFLYENTERETWTILRSNGTLACAVATGGTAEPLKGDPA